MFKSLDYLHGRIIQVKARPLISRFVFGLKIISVNAAGSFQIYF